MQQLYPDVSDLFEAKARRRHELMALSWEEKVRIIERQGERMTIFKVSLFRLFSPLFRFFVWQAQACQ